MAKTVTWNGIMITAMLLAGCDSQKIVTAPTGGSVLPPAKTSRVDPNTLEDSLLEGLTLDHDIWAPGVSLCETRPREYCKADLSECGMWTVDYYTVMAPEECPAEPIE